jgi:outer membrane lipoprotein SlyB
MKKAVVVLSLLLGACSGIEELTGRAPIVDMRGVNQAQYAADLAECEGYADQVQAGRQVATGAVAGAVVGGVVGAVFGSSDTAQRTAGAGAVAGGAQGAGGAMQDRRRVLRNCLDNRGYNVLN